MRRVVLVVAAIVLLDQLTKLLVVRFVGTEELVVIGGFFNLVNWRNTGAAWGIFQDRNEVLAIVSVVTILALCLFRHSFQVHQTGNACALGLIAGGIVGNLIDRVRVRHVIDFLDFHIGKHHWPAFNVADSAICIGVVLYIILSWRADRAARRVQTVA